MSRPWSREETIIVFNLYCKIPFNKASKNNPEVIKVANLIDRTPSSVGMKVGNFGSFDENLKAKNISGLKNASKLDRQIWDEFNGNWSALSYESENLIARFGSQESNARPLGSEAIIEAKRRVNHDFFRAVVSSAYNGVCCISGLSNSELLIASHIKPWSESDDDEKTDPRNGLLLNALHDKAFDRGLITVTTDFKIIISSDIRDVLGGRAVDDFFKKYDGRAINLPEKFLPKREFLEFHNDMIFENWKK